MLHRLDLGIAKQGFFDEGAQFYNSPALGDLLIRRIRCERLTPGGPILTARGERAGLKEHHKTNNRYESAST
ncbi:MAG TPA: hypothetical protein VFV34_03260 [Blastocatellia bacterium]|nr:hypothetical protein [Blastocatellia bacterium]